MKLTWLFLENDVNGGLRFLCYSFNDAFYKIFTTPSP